LRDSPRIIISTATRAYPTSTIEVRQLKKHNGKYLKIRYNFFGGVVYYNIN